MKILVCAPLQEAESKKIQEYFINDTVLIKRRPTQEDIDQVDVIVGNPHLDLNLNQEHLQALLLNSAGSDQYIKENEKRNIPQLHNSLQAYKKAEIYSRRNDFRIFNATRGGKLEVFERVDFDSLF